MRPVHPGPVSCPQFEFMRILLLGLPGAGKGLFTKTNIEKGQLIVEYKGKVTTWKEVEHNDGQNGYIYFVNRNYVIDASRRATALARYANDAHGLQKVKGLHNNAVYTELDKKVYIEAKKDIPAGSEILVPYGKEYWDVIRHNIRVEKARQKEREKAEAFKKKKAKSRKKKAK